MKQSSAVSAQGNAVRAWNNSLEIRVLNSKQFSVTSWIAQLLRSSISTTVKRIQPTLKDLVCYVVNGGYFSFLQHPYWHSGCVKFCGWQLNGSWKHCFSVTAELWGGCNCYETPAYKQKKKALLHESAGQNRDCWWIVRPIQKNHGEFSFVCSHQWLCIQTRLVQWQKETIQLHGLIYPPQTWVIYGLLNKQSVSLKDFFDITFLGDSVKIH